MIDLYYWPTPNGWKVTIMLEECGLEYRMIPVNIGAGEQFTPDFLAISPNNRMPAIVDHDAEGGALSVFESGAVLTYLAEKTGRFMPGDLRGRMAVQQWLFWQVGGLGPMAGQLSHFVNYAPEPMPYALERYKKEYDRLLGVMDRQLAETDFLAGDYSIADMAAWPWLLPYKAFGQSLDHLPNVRRWHDTIKQRPAVRRGVDVGKELRTFGKPMDEEARKTLFGQTAASGN
jgi:GST-like protein